MAMPLLFQIEEPTAPKLVGIAKLAASGQTLEVKKTVEYHDLPTRRWITRCQAERMPFSWTINPYRGCEFGCKYCYARYTHEFMELRGIDDSRRRFMPSSGMRRVLRRSCGELILLKRLRLERPPIRINPLSGDSS